MSCRTVVFCELAVVCVLKPLDRPKLWDITEPHVPNVSHVSLISFPNLKLPPRLSWTSKRLRDSHYDSGARWRTSS